MKRLLITAAFAAPLVLAGFCPAAFAPRTPPTEDPGQVRVVTATATITTPADDQSLNMMQTGSAWVNVTCASTHAISITGALANRVFYISYKFTPADGNPMTSVTGSRQTTNAMGEWSKLPVNYSGSLEFHPGWNNVTASSDATCDFGSGSGSKTNRFAVAVPSGG